MREQRPLRRFADRTRAHPAAVRRVRDRVLVDAGDVLPSTLLKALPAPVPGATTRVRARLARPAPRRIAPVPFVLVALAALALLAFRTFPSAPPPALAAGLDAPVAWEALQPTPEVHLDFQGAGTLGGTARAPRVAWERGTLRVEVEPDRGIDLAVQTREAEVRVVGTGFDVGRDALGTVVTVRHGHVAVMCTDGDDALLGAGESRTCPPTGASGLLGRAQALTDGGAPAEDVLAAADAGLAAGATGAVRSELGRVRIEALTRLGRPADALAAAEAALAEAPVRATEIRRLAAHNALLVGGCDTALPHLAALAADGAAGPELVQYADCVATSDPIAARAALTAALRSGAPSDQEAGIVARLTRLGAP
jgi:ferric-dicitrate binding protein FerR (iron transport regulator)